MLTPAQRKRILTCKSVDVVAFVKDLSNAHAIITFGIVEIVIQKVDIHSRLTVSGNRGALVIRRRALVKGIKGKKEKSG